MSGLDVLLNDKPEPQQTGLDVLLSGATTPPKPPGSLGSASGGAIQGVRDLQNGMAQWLYNSLPPSARSLGDAFDNWMYTKTGGSVGTRPGLNFNQAVTEQNQAYEEDRAANNRQGIDWPRVLSNAGSQTALAAVTGMPAGSAGSAGVFSGALAPVKDGDYTTQKAKDIAIGGLVGKTLGTIGSGIVGALSPKVSDEARALMNEGVKLTPGQSLGGWVKSFEDKMTSVPVIGDLIKGAQNRTVEDLNRAAYSRVLQPLKEAGIPTSAPSTVGRSGIESITDQVKGAYNDLIPKLTFRGDQQFAGELASVKQMAAQGLPSEQASLFARILKNTVEDRLSGGNASGKTLKGILEDLGEKAAGYASDPSFANREVANALKTVEQSIKDGVTRSNPQYAAKLAKIDEAFANLARVQVAGAMQGAQNGVFSAAQLAAAVKGGDRTVRDNAYAQGKALMQDLSDPAKSVIQSAIPNSGTADRAMTAGATGALLSNPLNALNPAVIAGAIPSAAYTKPGQALVNAALKERSPELKALAEMLRRYGQTGVVPSSAVSVDTIREALNR